MRLIDGHRPVAKLIGEANPDLAASERDMNYLAQGAVRQRRRRKIRGLGQLRGARPRPDPMAGAGATATSGRTARPRGGSGASASGCVTSCCCPAAAARFRETCHAADSGPAAAGRATSRPATARDPASDAAGSRVTARGLTRGAGHCARAA